MPRQTRSMSSSGGGEDEPPAYNSAAGTSAAGNVAQRRRQEFERQISAGQMRLRSGSAGHKPLKSEDPEFDDEEHEPIEV